MFRTIILGIRRFLAALGDTDVTHYSEISIGAGDFGGEISAFQTARHREPASNSMPAAKGRITGSPERRPNSVTFEPRFTRMKGIR